MNCPREGGGAFAPPGLTFSFVSFSLRAVGLLRSGRGFEVSPLLFQARFSGHPHFVHLLSVIILYHDNVIMSMLFQKKIKKSGPEYKSIRAFFMPLKRNMKVKEFAKSFYKSKAWQHTRSAYAASVGGLCERCLKAGTYRAGDIVHHKQELTPENINNPEISLAWDNLELLCRDCHGKAHGNERRYKVDEMGRVKI